MTGSSQNAKESQARASEEWGDFKQKLQEANANYLNAKARVKGFEARIKILQSLNKDRNFT